MACRHGCGVTHRREAPVNLKLTRVHRGLIVFGGFLWHHTPSDHNVRGLKIIL